MAARKRKAPARPGKRQQEWGGVRLTDLPPDVRGRLLDNLAFLESPEARRCYTQAWVRACEWRYRVTHNPLFAWHAFIDCCDLEQPVPAWVAEYLRRVGVRIVRVDDAKAKRPAALLAEALEMKRPGRSGGRWNVFADYERSVRDFQLAQAVQALIDDGHKVSQAWRLAGEAWRGHGRGGLSQKAPREAWRRYRPFLREPL